MKSTGLSVVGSGFIARKVLKEISDICNIVSVYSTNDESSKMLSEKYNAKHCFAFEEVLTDKNVDCIYITTPHTSHCHYASLALAAGKNVICEKPSAMNQMQIQHMLSLSESNNAYFSEIMHFRYSPVFSQLREIIDSQVYGKLKKVYADIGFNAYALPKRKRLLNKDAGGGALLDIGIYLAALIDFIFEDVTAENCTIHVEKNDDDVDVEDKLVGTINGVYCEFMCSLKQVLPSATVLEFENGQVEIPVFFKPSKLILKNEACTQIVDKGKFSFKVQFKKAFEDVHDGFKESQPYNHQSSFKTLCLLDKARENGDITYASKLENIDVLG